jgi:hypothetical protein
MHLRETASAIQRVFSSSMRSTAACLSLTVSCKIIRSGSISSLLCASISYSLSFVSCSQRLMASAFPQHRVCFAACSKHLSQTWFRGSFLLSHKKSLSFLSSDFIPSFLVCSLSRSALSLNLDGKALQSLSWHIILKG